jgi:hypothetical protein
VSTVVAVTSLTSALGSLGEEEQGLGELGTGCPPWANALSAPGDSWGRLHAFGGREDKGQELVPTSVSHGGGPGRCAD